MKYFVIIILAAICACKKNNNTGNPNPPQTRDTTINAYGGPGDDGFVTTLILSEVGYLSAGYSNSNGGQVTGNHGDYDYWIVKTDSARKIVWEKSFGGSASDKPIQMIRASDGKYLVIGTSLSVDGDRTSADGPLWVIKIDESGNLIWQKTYGNKFLPPNSTTATGIDNTPDGGFVFIANTDNGQGVIDGNIYKANHDGTLINAAQKGSTLSIYFNAVKAVANGYIVTGQTNFNDGIDTYHAAGDLYIQKFDTAMVSKWIHIYGGSGIDNATAILQTADRGFLIAGSSSSHDGDIAKNQGDLDWLICRLDSNGIMQWNTTMGGTGKEQADFISTTSDGNYLVSGYTTSKDGNVTGNQGKQDGWVVKIDDAGKILSQKTCGGPLNESFGTAVETTPNHFIFSGNTNSINGDINRAHGAADAWIFKY